MKKYIVSESANLAGNNTNNYLIPYSDFILHFYEHNKSIINLSISSDHSVDLKSVELYKANIPDNIHSVIDNIIQNIKYVSFDEFRHAFYTCLEKFEAYTNTNNKEYVIILPNTYEKIIKKSNFWLVLLLCDIIENNKQKFPNLNKNIKSIYIGTKYNDDLIDENILLIDDCSYSGQQLKETLSSIFKQKNKFIIVPYVTHISLPKLISGSNKDSIFYYELYDKTIGEKIDDYYIFIPKNGWIGLKEILTNNNDYVHLIYFQHKLADGKSIPQYFLNFAPIFPYCVKLNNYASIKEDITIFDMFDYLKKKMPDLEKTESYVIQIDDNIQIIDENDDTGDIAHLESETVHQSKQEIINIPINYTIGYKKQEQDLECVQLIKNCEQINLSGKQDHCLPLKNDYEDTDICYVPYYRTIKYKLLLEGGSYYNKYVKYKNKNKLLCVFPHSFQDGEIKNSFSRISK